MDFVGRKREIAAVVRSLKQGRNVVLTGRFGVGRSRLVKHISKLHSDSWQFLFADFSKPASQSCNDLIHQLIPHQSSSRRKRYTRLMYARDILLREKLATNLPRMVVLDNIGKISQQKLAFIRDFFTVCINRHRQKFPPATDLLRLRSVFILRICWPLHNLGKPATTAFFRCQGTAPRDENFIRM